MKRALLLICFLPTLLIAQVSIVKGPYLQIGTSSSMIIKWQTNLPTNTKALYGTNASSLNFSYTNSILDTIHEAFLSGLTPYTKYFYAIGSSTFTIQGDTNNYFVTSPLQGAEGKYRFWITGDCGNNSSNQLAVKNKYLQYNGNRLTNGWLLLGDNAYNDGLDSEYNSNFFSYYQTDVMKKTVLWPAPGNHDYANNLVNQNSHNVAYYNIFNLPSGGEAGGVWSGTEAFYSYNYGNIHFISLDSYGHELNAFRIYDTLGPQTTWLKQDLTSNVLPWTVVYFHHPPYTMGSHNSDSEGELDSIRKNLVRILERYKVDFVFCGHSHSYERSKLMRGHFGYENTFNSTQHHLSTSSAHYNGSPNSCPYIKESQNKGTVYIVAGSAGSLGGQQDSFPHNAMYFSNTTDGGSLIMDVEANRAEFRWLCADGVIRDSFTVFKNINKVTTHTLTSGQSATLTASWPGNYVWSGSLNTVRSHIIHPLSDTTYWVKDKFNCFADTFHIKIFTGIADLKNKASSFIIYPNPGEGDFKINIDLPEESLLNINVYSVNGTAYPIIKNKKYPKGTSVISLNTGDHRFLNGIYFVTLEINGQQYTKKLVVIK